eukprot:sb/3473321/
MPRTGQLTEGEAAYLEELVLMEAAERGESSGGDQGGGGGGGNFLRKASRRFSRIRPDPISEEGEVKEVKTRRLSMVRNRNKPAPGGGEGMDMSDKSRLNLYLEYSKPTLDPDEDMEEVKRLLFSPIHCHFDLCLLMIGASSWSIMKQFNCRP